MNLVCLVRTEKYLPLDFFAQILLLRCSVRTKISDQYFPVQTSLLILSTCTKTRNKYFPVRTSLLVCKYTL